MDARFWGENGGNDVDGRKVPDWVQSQPTYKEWVHFWRNCIVHGAVRHDIFHVAAFGFVRQLDFQLDLVGRN
jgi:hypothetical protein